MNKQLIIFDEDNNMWVDTEYFESLKAIREKQQKDIYARYKDTTTTPANPAPGMFANLTTICKSKFDNVVGWIKLRK